MNLKGSGGQVPWEWLEGGEHDIISFILNKTKYTKIFKKRENLVWQFDFLFYEKQRNMNDFNVRFGRNKFHF